MIANKKGVMLVLEKIRAIIADELGVEEDSIDVDSQLADDLGADSLDAVELIMAIEEEFDIEIDDSSATKMKTVQDIVDYLEKHTK
jgi:acyl carrier protein